MANENQLIAWAISNHETLRLQIEETSWIKEFFPQLSDMKVQISIEGLTFHGWGWGRTEEEALAKGIAEAIERALLQEYRFHTSNGLAAHLTQEKADRAATSELVERDLFLCHFLTKTPFAPLKRREGAQFTEAFSEWFQRRSILMRHFHLGQSGAVCLIDGRKAGFGFATGSAIKASLEESILAATLEAGRLIHRALTGHGTLTSLTLAEFNNLDSPSFADHWRLALDCSFATSVAGLFENEGFIKPEYQGDFHITPLHFRNELLRTCPLKFSRSTSSNVQDLYAGKTKPELVNFDRLSDFAGRQITWDDLNHLPHLMD